MSRTYRTSSGTTLTDADVERIADDVATRDYDIEELRPRGRPSLGLEPTRVVHVRIDGELDRGLRERAADDGTTASDVIRRALRHYLAGI